MKKLYSYDNLYDNFPFLSKSKTIFYPKYNNIKLIKKSKISKIQNCYYIDEIPQINLLSKTYHYLKN